MIEKISLFFIKEGVYLIIFILVICLLFVIYNRYKIKNPSSKSIDLTVILDGLSKDNNKKSDNRKYVNELLEKDNSSILNKLKKRELIDLFSIKANIEIYFKSQKDLDTDTLKYMGFVIVYIAGILSSVFAGIYSGIVSSLVSEIIKNNNPLDFKSDLDAKIGDIYYDVFKKVKNIVTLDSVLLPIITSVIIFFFLVMLFRISKFFKGKHYNKNNLLLDLVNYAIEFRKEEEMMENKNKTTAEVEEKAENETLKDLTTDLLDAKSTNVLLKGLDDKMEYDTIKNDISNYKLPELYPLKANLKNALDNGKYAYSIIFQYIAVFASFVTGLIVKDQPFCIIVIALLIISGLFLLITREIVTDKNDVKKRFLLEIVEEEIESKKNSNK